MKDIEDKLKEAYDNQEVPDEFFGIEKIFKRAEEEKEKRKNISRIVASIVAVLVLSIALVFVLPKILDENEVIIQEKGESTEKHIIDNLDIISKNTGYESFTNINVASIRVDKIKEYNIINNIPYTKVKATIINNYLGNLNNQIEMYIPGGIFTVKDLKDNVKEVLQDIEKFNNDDYIKVTYHKTIYIPFAEEEKTYITTLKNVNGEFFVDMDRPYGFKEYDPETNIVKDDMGDIELDIDKYLKNISK